MQTPNVLFGLTQIQDSLEMIEERLDSLCEGIDGTGTADQIEEIANDVRSLRSATAAFEAKARYDSQEVLTQAGG